MEPDGLAAVSDEELAAALPDRPVVTLRDVEVVYGTLYALATGGGGEYASYLSPDAAGDLLGETAGVLVVRVDLTGDTPRLAADERGVVDTVGYNDSMLQKVAHSKFQAARGVDHSLTHETGQRNDAAKHADHAVDRFTRWPTESAVVSVSEDHPDGYLIDALRRLGENEATMERLHDVIVEGGAVPEPRHSLVTVAFRVDDHRLDALATTGVFDPSAEWHYPGEFEVFQEAMAARKTEKFRSKSAADDAVGEGTCYVFDTDEQVYGVVDDPMKSYLSKQAERFPRLDPDESWRTQGLSRDAAVAAQNATTFLDACQYSGPGVSVYCLPRFVDEMDAEDARQLYQILAAQVNANDDDANPVETVAGTDTEAIKREWNDDFDESRLRFQVQIVHKYQKDRWRLLAGQPDAPYRHVKALGETHYELLDSDRWIGGDGPFHRVQNFPMLDPSLSKEGAIGIVASPSYFVQTCGGEAGDDPSSDDFRFRATARILAGEPVDADELLGEYVRRITDRFDPDSEHPFPDVTVTEQYVQLRVLAAHGLLDANSTDLTHMTTQKTTSDRDGGQLNRIETFEEFLDEHDRLDHPGRRGVFALGALVGRITRYQRDEDKSATAVKNHPVGGLTLNNLERTATEVVEANVVYSDEKNLQTAMFGELMTEVSDSLERVAPDDWNLSTHDVRFHYAMGIAYGLNDNSPSPQGEDDDD